MDQMFGKIKETAAFLEDKGFAHAHTAVVLGTGLGSLLEHLRIVETISYQEIPHFPVATVESHKGRLLLGEMDGHRVLVLQGRFHYYEGYSMQQITFPVRVAKALGVETLLLSNAAGGMNPAYKKGDLVLLTDHINLQPENPLRGAHDPALGDRFPDMSRPYHPVLNRLIADTAREMDIPLKEGIYVAVMGPNLETRAEYRFLRMAGADMVGMSTVPEVIVAAQAGLRCAAVSVITDECDPDNLQPVDIREIIAVAGKADEKLAALLARVLRNV